MIVSLDSELAAAMLGRLGANLRAFPGALSKTIVTTVNSVAARTRTRAITLLKKRYAAKPESIAGKIKIKKAYGNVLGASVWGIKRGSSLSSYPHEAIAVRIGNRNYRGVKVNVMKGGAWKTVKRGFLAKGKGDVALIYKWKSGKLKALYGPSLSGWFAVEENLNDLTEVARQRIGKTLQAVAENNLKKLGVM